MLLIEKRNNKIIILLLIILCSLVKSNDSLDDKFYFQLYPSDNEEKPYLFHAYTPNSQIITINSTEGENCNIIENKKVNEYPIKGISSVAIYNQKLLIKTCFGPNKIVEIINENKETFSPENNNFFGSRTNLNNIKYCYTTTIVNPKEKNKIIIMTYWTEFKISNGKEKYTHKYILFDPITKRFSEEKILTVYSNFIQNFIIDPNFYAKSCTTFRNVDIYCSISLNSSISYANTFIIDTNKLDTSDPQIRFVLSTTDYGNNIYQNPISINIQVHDLILGWLFDAFLTEYHNKEENKTILVSSLFRKNIYTSFIYISDKKQKYYGINIEDDYIDQNLFNHLLPNKNDLIIIYTMKTGNKMSLVMSKFNLTNSMTYHKKFKEYALSNYLRDDICSNPKYIQSIFVNSFINYNDEDKKTIRNNGSNKYYKYQKDIVTFIACEDEQKNVFYESKKIIMPQCLDVLDKLNNKDNHVIKFKQGENNITLDIFNDPNLISLRNVTIEFLPIDYKNIPFIIMIKTDKTNLTYINCSYTNVIRNPTHIRIFRTINFKSKDPLAIPYRLKQTSSNGDVLTCHLSSDLCKFELMLKNEGESDCNCDYCVMCDSNSLCIQCDSEIGGILLDEKNNRCICDKDKGFQLYPKSFDSEIMCICEEDYSFYKNISICMPNSILKNGSYCVERIDEVSLIPIYDDHCSENCTFENGILICKNNITIDPSVPSLPKDDICFNKTKNIWFEIEDKKFYYAKINNCVYIYHNNSLFFYSNKNDCLFNNNHFINYSYISECLNNSEINEEKDYKNIINNSTEYDPNEEKVVISKEIGNFNFHLVNKQKDIHYSELQISKECEKILKSDYIIDDDLNLLIFKVDIKRNDTISRQVEYNIYNPMPNKIYQKLDLSKCSPDKLRILTESNENLNINEANILSPSDWNELQIQFIEELYFNHSINIFSQNESFYNDVCFKYTTSFKTDIYIQNRREKYYIKESLCQSDCNFIGIKEYNKIKCKCGLKLMPMNPESISFTKKYNNSLFKKNIAPNIKVLKCAKEAFKTPSFGFFLTLILFVLFVLSFLLRIKKGEQFNNTFKELNNQINQFSEKNLKPIEEKDEEELEHLFKKNNTENKNLEEVKDKGQDNNILGKTNKRSIKNNSHKTDQFSNIDDKNNEENIENKDNIDNEGKIGEKSQNNNKISVINLNNNKNLENENNKSKDLISKNSIEKKNQENEEEEDEKEEKIEIAKKKKKGKKKKKKGKTEKAKEEEKTNSSETNKVKGRKKSKSKKKIMESNIIISDSQSKEEIEKIHKKENDKISQHTEGLEVKNHQKNGVYDNDENSFIFGGVNIEDSMDKKYEESQNDEIKDEVENKEVDNNLIENDDPDMEYDKPENENNQKKQKKNKKNNYPSNPPKNSNSEGNNNNSFQNHTSFISGKVNIPNDNIIDVKGNDSDRMKVNSENNEMSNNNLINYNDYILDQMDYETAQKFDTRGFLKILFSMIKNNSTILFANPFDKNDLYTKASVIILTLSFFLFINLLLMFDSSILHLYTDRDPILKEKFNVKYFIINTLIPFLFYIPISSFLKQNTSIKEFIYYKNFQVSQIEGNANLREGQKSLEFHDITTDNSKFKNEKEDSAKLLFIGGCIFLLFNWYAVTCFCGIYENSEDCLIINTVVSIISSIILSIILFIISASLRSYSLSNKKKIIYYISSFLNPIFYMYDNVRIKKEKSN